MTRGGQPGLSWVCFGFPADAGGIVPTDCNKSSLFFGGKRSAIQLEAGLCSLLVCAAVALRVPWSETIC